MVHLLLTHDGGATSALSLTLDAPPTAVTRDFVFYGENGVESVPPGDGNALTAFGTAVDQLLAEIDSGGGTTGVTSVSAVRWWPSWRRRRPPAPRPAPSTSTADPPTLPACRGSALPWRWAHRVPEPSVGRACHGSAHRASAHRASAHRASAHRASGLSCVGHAAGRSCRVSGDLVVGHALVAARSLVGHALVGHAAGRSCRVSGTRWAGMVVGRACRSVGLVVCRARVGRARSLVARAVQLGLSCVVCRARSSVGCVGGGSLVRRRTSGLGGINLPRVILICGQWVSCWGHAG